MQVVTGVVRKTLMTFFLIVLYCVGFGITRLFLSFFKCDLVTRNCSRETVQWWEIPKEEAADDDPLRQA